MADSLKACPFCGGEAELYSTRNTSGVWFELCWLVQCTICGCRTATEISDHDAINIWNTRKPPCNEAEHDSVGCLGYGKGEYDDEPIDVCKNCSKYTGNIVTESSENDG